jgi:hypothetical protein
MRDHDTRCGVRDVWFYGLGGSGLSGEARRTFDALPKGSAQMFLTQSTAG